MNDEGRISRGWRLTRLAWGVLLHDRTALILAALQAVAAAAVAVAVFTLSGWIRHPGQESRLLLAVVISYLPSTLISTFIGVALCAAVAAAMDGGSLSLGEALAVPARRFGQIVLWSLLAAGVGVLLEQVAARLPFGAKLVSWLAGVAWSIGTLFVLPILALNGCDAPECVRRSAGLIRRRWGEGVTGSLVIGAWAVVVVLPLGFAGGIVEAASHSRQTGWQILLALMVLVGSVTWAATRVFSVALYRYAIGTGNVAPFPESDLRRPFRPRGWRPWGGRGDDHPTGGASELREGATDGDGGSSPARRRPGRRLIVSGAVLIVGVFIVNVLTTSSRRPHHGASNLGPGHGEVYGLILLLGLLLVLIGFVVRLGSWLMRRRARRRHA